MNQKRRDEYWTCPTCGKRNHFSSDTCYMSPGCRAAVLEQSARYYEGKAAELRRRAAAARQEALEEQATDWRDRIVEAQP